MSAQQTFRIALLLSLAWLVPRPVLAHEGDPSGGFLSGFTHPLLGPDHVLAMVAVGLWGAQLRAPSIWLLPVAFPLVMAVGGFLGLIGVRIPGVEIGIALSAIVLGLAVFRRAKPPLPVALGLVGLFAVFHGHAHGTELPPGDSGILYSLGFVIGTGLLHGCGIVLGLIDHVRWGKPLVQAAGLLIAAGGCGFLYRALA